MSIENFNTNKLLGIWLWEPVYGCRCNHKCVHVVMQFSLSYHSHHSLMFRCVHFTTTAVSGVGGVGMLSSPLAMASPYGYGASDPDDDTIPSVLYGKGKRIISCWEI